MAMLFQVQVFWVVTPYSVAVDGVLPQSRVITNDVTDCINLLLRK